MTPRWVAAGAAVAVLAAVVLGGWWFVFRGDSPPPASLESAVAGLTTATPAGDASTATVDVPADATAAAPAGDGSLAATWTIDASRSFVGYRIDEELAQIGASTAVGRTSDVSGTLEFDGSAITGVEVVANLGALQSDDSRRDNRLRSQALETDAYPDATFTLAEPVMLDATPVEGEAIEATAVGDLTIHGVTQRVQLPLRGQLAGGLVVVVGSAVVRLADYEIEAPTAPLVLGVADQATIEMELVFQPV